MRKRIIRTLSVVLCIAILVCSMSMGVSAADIDKNDFLFTACADGALMTVLTSIFHTGE